MFVKCCKNLHDKNTTQTNICIEKEQGIAPTFTKPLKIEITQVEEDKSKAIVTCQVTGSPKPSVKWFKGIEEVVPTESVQTFYDETTGEAILEVYNPQVNEPLVYSIQAENPFGKAVGNANILREIQEPEETREILKPPKVTPLTAETVRTGGTLTFKSKYQGIPRPEIKWLRNGREIIVNEDVTIDTTEDTTTITVINMTRKRAGKYEVCAKNKVGEAKASGSVMVTDTTETEKIVAPRFIQPLEPRFITENEVCIVEAIVESEPLSSFQWFIHNELVVPSEDVRVITQENKSILLIESFQKKFSGPFMCRAENVGGSVTSTATIQLLEDTQFEETQEFTSPRFIEQLEPVNVMDGEKLILTCQVEGFPTPKVQWYRNNEKVTETKDLTMYQDTQGLCVLSVQEVFPEDEGQYACQAVNKVGEAITSTTVNVEGIWFHVSLTLPKTDNISFKNC